MPLHRRLLTWTDPTAGLVVGFHVFRAEVIGGSLTPPVEIGSTDPDTRTFIDTEELPHFVQYGYFIKADVSTGTGIEATGASNVVRIRAVNDAPIANGDNYGVNQGGTLVVSAAGVLGNDTDTDSPSFSAVLTTPPANGALTLAADGSLTYVPAPTFFGTDSFTYQAKDVSPLSARNVPATVVITVRELVPPIVTLTIPPPNGGNGFFKTKPVIVSVAATDPSNVQSFSCTDNGSAIGVGSLAGIGTPSASGTLSVIAEGNHALVCQATDGFGNFGAAPGSANTGSLKIDTVPPETTINSGPADEITTASATFTFSGTDATSGVASFECRFDGSAFAACTSPQTRSGLTIGPHTFDVRAIDAAGNVDATPATKTFKVIYTITLTPLKTSATQGSAVQLNWLLADPAGNPVMSLSTLVKLESVFNGSGAACVASDVGTREVIYQMPIGSTGNSEFRNTQQGFQFNWDTTTTLTNPIKTPKGCYTVLIYLSDQSAAKKTTPVQLK